MLPFKEFGEILQKAKTIREDMKKLQDSLKNKTVEVSSGGGMVKVVANGASEIISITFDDEMLKRADQQMLQDLVVSGINQALKASRDLVADEMKKLTASLGPLSSLLDGYLDEK